MARSRGGSGQRESRRAMAETSESWREWIGREQRVRDLLDPARAQAMHATLERPGEPPSAGDPLPPLWHLIYFWSIAPMADLGSDGHLALGRFLPPFDRPPLNLPRRMWAGSRFTFHRPLTIGAPAERRSTIENVTLKQGRSGPLAFVTVRHRHTDGEGLCLEEEQDLVFRTPQGPAAGGGGAAAGMPDPPAWRRRVEPSAVFLFRYSALTFNGHRIHYDRDYARDAEGYPDLVMHGPLLGTLMIQLALDENAGRRPASYRFRLLRPVFAGQGIEIAGLPDAEGAGARLFVVREDGSLAAEGWLDFA